MGTNPNVYFFLREEHMFFYRKEANIMYYEFRGNLVRGWVPRLNRFLYFVSFEEFIEYLKEEEK